MVSTMKIFNVTVPQRNGLCCAICKIVSSENDPIIYSNYCGSRLKCGQILRGIPQVMAAPITNRKLLETGSCLYIIAERDIFESIFQDHCKAFNVQLVDLVDPVPIYIYKACLLYTVEYRLAPQWNKVGTYLVEGQNFLSSTGNVHAITLNIKDIRGTTLGFKHHGKNKNWSIMRV